MIELKRFGGAPNGYPFASYLEFMDPTVAGTAMPKWMCHSQPYMFLLHPSHTKTPKCTSLSTTSRVAPTRSYHQARKNYVSKANTSHQSIW
jgi:hypothetical protein